jgi:hypothetical protein
MPQPYNPSVIVCILFGENTDCGVTSNFEVFYHLTMSNANFILPLIGSKYSSASVSMGYSSKTYCIYVKPQIIPNAINVIFV